jgi:hypothetical protein
MNILNKINSAIDKSPKLAWLLKTHIGRLALATIMSVFGGATETYILPLFMSEEAIESFPLFRGIMFVGLGIFLIYFVVMMYWAIKNTISDIKEK